MPFNIDGEFERGDNSLDLDLAFDFSSLTVDLNAGVIPLENNPVTPTSDPTSAVTTDPTPSDPAAPTPAAPLDPTVVATPPDPGVPDGAFTPPPTPTDPSVDTSDADLTVIGHLHMSSLFDGVSFFN